MDQKLLKKFFKNECSEEEVKKILSWFEQERPGEIPLWRSLWDSFEKQASSDPSHRQFILSQIHHSIYKERPLPGPQHKKYSRIYLAKVVASFLLLLSASLYIGYFLVYPNKEKESLVSSKTVVKENPKGMKKIFHLQDSSKVFLNSDSKLTFPENFTGEKRELMLYGEAFFEVKKDPFKPFIVKTGELTTTALGTAFNVKSFEEENCVVVSLTKGKVQIDYKENPENRLILIPGEQAILDKNTGDLIKRTFDPKEVTAWTTNKLLFKNASLEEIIKKLERWYGVTIKTENGHSNAGKHWNYSGEFDNEPLRNVLNGISYVKNFTYKMEGKHVNIYL